MCFKWTGLNSTLPWGKVSPIHTWWEGYSKLTKLPVDTPNQLIDGPAKVLVFFDVLSRRDCDLDELDLANPLRVSLEEILHRVEFLRDTFDVVQTVDTDDELDALELLLKLLDTFLYLWPLQAVDELFRVNADGERTDRNDLARILAGIWSGHQASAKRVSRLKSLIKDRTIYSIRLQLLRKCLA